MNKVLGRDGERARIGERFGALDYRGEMVDDYSIEIDGQFWEVIGGRLAAFGDRPGPGPIYLPSGDLQGESRADILARVDATLLRPEASREEVREFALQARDLQSRNVCLFPARIPDVLDLWPRPATVISFPHGADGLASKLAQIEVALELGAGEIDLVADQSLIAAENWTGLERELTAIRQECPVSIKVILETGRMPLSRIPDAARAVRASGCDYAKTSTGMIPEGASIEAVRAIRQACPDLGIKASGGIRTREAASEMIRAGADVLGASDPSGLVA
jgi:deoxyribose-phosphate aldolase